MQTIELTKIIENELTLRKGENITLIDVKGRTSVTDAMLIVTATSERHAQALAHYVTEKVKEYGIRPLGLEGQRSSDWVLLDLGDILLHLMTPTARERYQLEKLWSVATRSHEMSLAAGI
jgi:ribosome-associated protein